MIFIRMILGPLETNTYIIGCEKNREFILIDPGFEPKRILNQLNKKKIEKLYVLLTHGHFDHSLNLDKIKDSYPDLILMYHKSEYNPQQKKPSEKNIEKIISLMMELDLNNSKGDIENNQENLELLKEYGLFSNILADKWIDEGSVIKIGDATFHTLATPGHSPGSLSFYTNDLMEVRGHLVDGVILTGDTLLKRTVGQFDIPRGNRDTLFLTIKNKIFHNKDFTDNFKILGGHYGFTTIGEEKLLNSFKEHFL